MAVNLFAYLKLDAGELAAVIEALEKLEAERIEYVKTKAEYYPRDTADEKLIHVQSARRKAVLYQGMLDRCGMPSGTGERVPVPEELPY